MPWDWSSYSAGITGSRCFEFPITPDTIYLQYSLQAALPHQKKMPCFFCHQTQEVQKAMDEKKFDEAVRLRGRYL